MTREEAIKELKEYEDGLDLEYATPFDKAILYAIKTLEQNPCGDAISRADVKNAMYKVCLHEENKDIFVKLLDEINKLHPVNPQPKTGHWIWCVGSHKCSNCEEYTCFSHKELLRYCPNCGAKMVEPQGGSEE